MNKTAFSMDELEVVGNYKEQLSGKEYIKLNTPITPKENYLRAIRHENPLWIPLKSDEFMFCPRIIPDNIARAWVLEKNKYEGPVGGLDMFGIDWEFVPAVGGSMVRPGSCALPDLTKWREIIRVPDVDSWDWEGCAAENAEFVKACDQYVVSWMFTGMFERLISFMDFEEALVALIDEDLEDDLNDIFQMITDVNIKIIRNLKKYFAIDAILFHDDWGGQKAPFFSVDTCREKIAPFIKQIVDVCHELGLIFDFHSCGKIDQLVPIMIECGVDKWGGQPINDKANIARTYGDKLIVGSTDTLSPGPKGSAVTAEELADKVEAYIQEYTGGDKTKLFSILNRGANNEVIKAFYIAGRKFLSE